MQRKGARDARVSEVGASVRGRTDPLEADPKQALKTARSLLRESYGLAHGTVWSTKSVLGKTGREKRAGRLRIAAGQLATAATFIQQVQHDKSTDTLSLKPRHIEKLQAAGQEWYAELVTADHAREIRQLKLELQRHMQGQEVSECFDAKRRLEELQSFDRSQLLEGWVVGGAHLESASERGTAMGDCAQLARRAEAAVRADITRTENYLEARKVKSARFTKLLSGVILVLLVITYAIYDVYIRPQLERQQRGGVPSWAKIHPKWGNVELFDRPVNEWHLDAEHYHTGKTPPPPPHGP